MKVSNNTLDSKLMSDILLLVMLIVTAIIFMQYSQEIENEITTAVLNSVSDINNSIAETRTGG
ncbi:hypothetical protein PP182_11285 [Maribacter sp. PR1]|uniref:Class III signal peptide-containing protein n=1 Tax=Maribacter cobaltidurans TaxID=1178778 RepID=A0ABU7IUJ7_9FLAO|nr:MULTISPECIES: hypothetical protein [Maribacter]MDC6389267.1 hypothetical protein [Maribacter sp. PR1]MEE1976655.1 hypothetical protein [Maribacter cobaltidurans]